MHIATLKFLAHFIIAHFSLLKDEAFLKALFEEIQRTNNWIGGRYPCKVDSEYPKPRIPFACYLLATYPFFDYSQIPYERLRLFANGLFHFELVIRETVSEKKRVRITIKTDAILDKLFPPMNRKDLKETRLAIARQRGFENLIILSTEKPLEAQFNELVLQLGIYLYRVGIFRDFWGLYGIYSEILNRKTKDISRQDTKDMEIFKRILNNFVIPGSAKSFETYVKIGVTEMKREAEGYKGIIPKSTFYKYLRTRKIPARKKNGKYQYTQETLKTIRTYEEKYREKEDWRELRNALALIRNISKTSANRQIERLRKKGFSYDDVIKKYREEFKKSINFGQ